MFEYSISDFFEAQNVDGVCIVGNSGFCWASVGELCCCCVWFVFWRVLPVLVLFMRAGGFVGVKVFRWKNE